MERLHRQRIVITAVAPELDGGRYPVKRVVGDTFTVRATIFRDGHDKLSAVLRYRVADGDDWREVPLTCINPGLDLWTAQFPLPRVGAYRYTIEAWTDVFGSWRYELQKKAEAGADVTSELLEGIHLIEQAAQRADDGDRAALRAAADAINAVAEQQQAVALALSERLADLMARHPDRTTATHLGRELTVVVDREIARFAAWYEFFPRSQGTEPGQSGTFRDCIRRLPDIAAMGFDVVYLPPIHPIGHAFRKGKNNSLTPGPDEPGSPWAIGNDQGGHTAVEPSLGTLEDFDAFVAAAKDLGIEVALDFAIQCSPDHPWVKEHPEWFSHRPDGTIKYAENPPKKYQDIYPINFDSDAWPSLWEELKNVLLFWIGHGVTTFRVDNPHTKPVPFWEWVIAEVQKQHPGVVFLAEAFTRPPMMKTLAKVGFTQSYTYFTWRNARNEIIEYLEELTQTEMAEYYRGNFFANTPDILHAYLVRGGKPAFRVRLLLAATLSSVYGIYSGFEFAENVPLREGSEEYLDSEKYEIKVRDWDAPGNLKAEIALINRARRANPALQLYDNLRFHVTENPDLLAYSKATPDNANRVIVIANLNPYRDQYGHVMLDLKALGLGEREPFKVQDAYTGQVFQWQGNRPWVRIDPAVAPGHLLIVRR
jgi:starch synthase (maltosyl-transferring)